LWRDSVHKSRRLSQQSNSSLTITSYGWIATFWYDWGKKMKVGLNNFWVPHFTIIYARITHQNFPNTLLYIKWDTRNIVHSLLNLMINYVLYSGKLESFDQYYKETSSRKSLIIHRFARWSLLNWIALQNNISEWLRLGNLWKIVTLHYFRKKRHTLKKNRYFTEPTKKVSEMYKSVQMCPKSQKKDKNLRNL
jgi:hypothetical protein